METKTKTTKKVLRRKVAKKSANNDRELKFPSTPKVWPKYDKPFYFHFRENPFNAISNGITVCMKPHKDRVGIDGEFKVGVACCSKVENFGRKLGRDISTGRAKISNTIVGASGMRELKEKAILIAKEVVENKKHGKKISI